MSAHVDDANTQYATEDITIDSVVYVCESWSDDEPSDVIERRTSAGLVAGQRLTPGFVTATATLQLPNAGTRPPLHETFTKDGSTWIVSQVGKTEESQGIKKVGISARKRIVTP